MTVVKSYRSEGTEAAKVAAAPSAVPLYAKASANDPLPGANKTERAYALHLVSLVAERRIARWWWAPGSIRLAQSLHWQPDFLVQYPDGVLEYVDVKGAKGANYYVTEDSWVKIKTTADMYPYRVAIAWMPRGEAWKREVVGRAAVLADEEAA